MAIWLKKQEIINLLLFCKVPSLLYEDYTEGF